MGPAAEVGSTANSYEILAKLATGGMAEIFLARGASGGGVERYVVLKRILRERAADIHFVRMFLDEARLAAQLQHPNIAQVYDIGKLGESYFFTMEYVHGETVRSLLQRAYGLRRQLPLGCVLAIAAGAAAGLHHAHERSGMDGKPLGIVHRDVSPSNLMTSFEGNVKVVDFGVALAAHRTQETRSGTVKGKISYLSPEQCRGWQIDRRSDLFSLGIVMWEMLTTERLYRRASDFEAMAAIVNEPPLPPSSRRDDIPPELDALVMRALAKLPGDRFESAEQMLENIEAIAVQTSSPLSGASLGKFVRELFGQRPLPWVELREDVHAEVVTVTSEPIPPELSIPAAHTVDRQLASLLDLSAGESSESSMPAVTTVPMRAVKLAEAVATEPVRTVGIHPTLQGVVAPSMTRALVASESALTFGASLSQSAAPMVPVSSASPVPQLPVPPVSPVPRRPRVWIVAAAALAAAAIAITVVVLAPTSPAITASDAAAQVAAVPTSAPPPVPAPGPAPAPPIVDTDIVVDEPVDAAVAPPPPTPVAPMPGVPAAAADDTRPRPHRVRDPAPPHDIVKSFESGRFADAVAACSASSNNAAANGFACTLAACHVRDLAKARKWLTSVPAAKRAHVIESCQVQHVELEPPAPPPDHRPPPSKPAAPDCVVDPMACQR